MSQTLYSGPGKTYFNGKSFQAQGENGQVKIDVTEVRSPVANAMIGRVAETFEEPLAKITTTPFDDYSLLTTLLPLFLGVSTPTFTGKLAIGARPHDNYRVTSAGSSVALVPVLV